MFAADLKLWTRLTGSLWLGQVRWDMDPTSSDVSTPPNDLPMKGLWHGGQVGVNGGPLTPQLGVPQITPLYSTKNGVIKKHTSWWPTAMVFTPFDHLYELAKTQYWNLGISTIHARNSPKTKKTANFQRPKNGVVGQFKGDFWSTGPRFDMALVKKRWSRVELSVKYGLRSAQKNLIFVKSTLLVKKVEFWFKLQKGVIITFNFSHLGQILGPESQFFTNRLDFTFLALLLKNPNFTLFQVSSPK